MISAEVFCQPKKKNFPKKCSLEIESYGFSDSDIVYAWKSSRNSTIAGNTILNSEYDLLDYKELSEIIQLSTGNYSRLTADLTITRL